MEEKEKFEMIYLQYYKLMYSVAYGILRDREEAEDSVQEAFLKIYKYIDKISEPICPKTRNFIVIISKNVALDMLRKKQGMVVEILSPDLKDGRTETNPEMAGEAKSVREQVIVAIREMPERYRNCLYLSILYEYTPKEIASVLGIKEQGAYKRLKRGKQRLQKKLLERGITL